MKLIIQIPCLNEAEQLPRTLADLPRHLPGFDRVEWLVIDDGSTDGTAEVARAHGVDHVISFPHNQGLARAFMEGLEASLRAGADVIVNFDADNQYRADGIPKITAPILDGRAKMVVGARPVGEIEHFSPIKRALQKLGSKVVRIVSQADVADAPSGFRAFDREAALRLYVFSRYSYTLETIIQAGRLNVPVVSVPIDVNPPTRESRLMRSMASYIRRSAVIILRIFVLYYPLRFFGALALVAGLPGVAAFVRFLYFYAQGDGGGHVQSLVMGAGLIAAATVLAIGGLLGDLISANRTLLAEIRARLLEAEISRARTAGAAPPQAQPVRAPVSLASATQKAARSDG